MGMKIELVLSEESKEFARLTVDMDFLKSFFEGADWKGLGDALGQINGLLQQKQEEAALKFAQTIADGPPKE